MVQRWSNYVVSLFEIPRRFVAAVIKIANAGNNRIEHHPVGIISIPPNAPSGKSTCSNTVNNMRKNTPYAFPQRRETSINTTRHHPSVVAITETARDDRAATSAPSAQT